MLDAQMTQESNRAKSAKSLVARALLLGERIDTARIERPGAISTVPLAFQIGATGFVAVYRFGIVVLVGLSTREVEDVLLQVSPHVAGSRERVDDETATLEIAPDNEDKITPGGPVQIKDLSPERFLVIADALAKSVWLARDEREVNGVFDIIQPFATDLARNGRLLRNRKSILRLIGQTLLAQHRVSGHVGIDEKPDILWDRPDLERLYLRLEDEYELKERSHALKHKLDVIVDSARALTDIIDASRSTRLEQIIVILIVAEVLLSLSQMLFWHR